MGNIFENFKMIEPLKKNRFLISFNGLEIPEYCFRHFKMYNEGEELIFETSIWQTINYTFNPKGIFDIVGVKVELLDPTGVVVNGYTFDVKGSNFETDFDYGDDNISTIHFKFVINTSTLKLININS
jgi:hypothetical protein